LYSFYYITLFSYNFQVKLYIILKFKEQIAKSCRIFSNNRRFIPIIGIKKSIWSIFTCRHIIKNPRQRQIAALSGI
jgi:hypothetical protein